MTELFSMTTPNLVSRETEDGERLAPAYRVFNVCGIYPIDAENRPEHVGEGYAEANGDIEIFFPEGRCLNVVEETMFILRPYPKAA